MAYPLLFLQKVGSSSLYFSSVAPEGREPYLPNKPVILSEAKDLRPDLKLNLDEHLHSCFSSAGTLAGVFSSIQQKFARF